MKVAVGIIGICLGLIVFMQSCALTMTATVVGHRPIEDAGAAGVIIGLLFFVAGAFAFGMPMVSAVIFTVTALLAISNATHFEDMYVWSVVCLILAAMSFFASRSARKKATEPGA